MEKLYLSPAPSPTISRFSFSAALPISRVRALRKPSFRSLTNPKKFSVFALKNDPNDKLNQWDLMELKFGRLLGEDPKLTLAKIMGRKTNPDVSYLEIEKNFYKNKGKLVEVKEVPFDVLEKAGSSEASNGLNLVKPVPKKGIKVGGAEDSTKLPEIKRPNESIKSTSRSVTKSNVPNVVLQKPSLVIEKDDEVDSPSRTNESIKSTGDNVTKSNVPNVILRKASMINEKYDEVDSSSRPNESIKCTGGSVTKSNVPNVILRKPSLVNEKDEVDNSSKLRIKPNLSLSMRTEPVKEKFSGMTLLKKPEPVNKNEDHGSENQSSLTSESVPISRLSDGIEDDVVNGGQSSMSSSGELTLSGKPKAVMHRNAHGEMVSSWSNGTPGMLGDCTDGFPDSETVLLSKQDQLGEDSQTGMQHFEHTDAGHSGNKIRLSKSPVLDSSSSEFTDDVALLDRPTRLEQSLKEMSYPIREEENISVNCENFDGQGEEDKLPLSRPLREVEETDWRRVEQHFNIRDRVEVELISCSPRGFVVSFGSLIGFLPYRNLAAKWKFLAFESWLRKNGLDPSKYRQNLGIVGDDEFSNKNSSLGSSSSTEISQKELEIRADMELDDLLRIYDQEKIQYLSSYIGQHIKVSILSADRKSRKLIFSMRPKEKEEIVERKRSLMAKLSIGDVVKCCIKKITYFGVFVEVEGVPALIHQTEVSWDATFDPSSYLKIGQIVEAKVHQLDFASERIFLSLKEITPDPLNEALECIVGNNTTNRGLGATQADSEWTEVDSLIKELQEIDGVHTVTKGRFFLSPGLAPTFQVYMASMFENQYKLLARSGNKVQEVIVEASLDKEGMKSAICKCTARVEL